MPMPNRPHAAPLLLHVVLILYALLALLPPAAAAADSDMRLIFKTPSEFKIYECAPERECEECGSEDSNPWCRATGNKQALACTLHTTLPLTTPPWWDPTTVMHVTTKEDEAAHIPAWAACEEPGAETFRFFLFEVANIILLGAAATVIFCRRRPRFMLGDGYRRLASRRGPSGARV
ncbi:hypothetical protein DFJ77DRAFT_358600 [Powellomyces hirtus]|nr:hypothetical protein DFJ77DRAFT_358600 [Powellomyces hirtus]